MSSPVISSFSQLGLSDAVVRAVFEVGYETPSPIQAAAIGPLLAGKDILGQAQTGTGKTAAFALPLLSRLDVSLLKPQVLVLTPTRELAIQVAEAFQTYARFIAGFHVLPVYGGQSLETQLRPLRRGVHVVVGTPGRIMDHLRRRTLVLDSLATVVLDEADEMLRMGFIDDVGEILDQTPSGKQLALFSATLPEPIRAIARRHTRDPVEIRIASATSTVSTVTQRYWQVSGMHKLDALTRILEVANFDAMLIFVRTKIATTELADRLEARGFSCAPLNGDMNQATRELTIERLKSGRLDILVATDVAARGLDVNRISHVVNYDIPYDTEAYVHRIGRTARAGRTGEAILFVAPRERRMLRSIEQATGQNITPMNIPSREDIAGVRSERFKSAITEVLASQDLDLYEEVVTSYQSEHGVSVTRIAAALACMAQGDRPLLPPEVRDERPIPPQPQGRPPQRHEPVRATARGADRPREDRPREHPGRDERSRDRAVHDAGPREDRPRDGGRERPRAAGPPRPDTVRYRIEVGAAHGVQPKNIVGAIANEAGLESQHIGPITIHDEYSTVDLPAGMPRDLFKHLKQVWVCGRRLRMSVLESGDGAEQPAKTREPERDDRDAAPAGAKPRKPKDKGRKNKDKGKPKREKKHKS